MRIILLVLSLVFISLNSAAQNRGVSYIGVCHKAVKYRDVLSIFGGRKVIAIHYLVRTFNRSGCPVMDRLIKDPRPMILHVSLLNGPGLRNRRLQSFEYLHGFNIQTAEAAILRRDETILKQVRASAMEVARLISLRGNAPLVLRIKTCLECDFSAKAREILNQTVAHILPGAEFIDNPHRHRCLKGLLCETHGESVSGDILDLDGTDYDSIDQLHWTRAGEARRNQFIWKLCNNGFKKGERWIPPATRRNFCNRRDLKEFNFWVHESALTVSEAPDPRDLSNCNKLISPRDGFRKGFIWKLGDGRSSAVALLPLEDGRETNWGEAVVSKDGRTFDSAFSRGRYRHDPAGNQRQVFQFSKHTADYKDNVVIRVDGGVRCVLLQKPQFRND